MQNAKVKALAPWFGGKRTMAPDVVRELGKHTQYFEPFCGSMAVLLAKPTSQKETVNDLHGDLINLARVISHEYAAPVLYKKLQAAVMCEALLEQAKSELAVEMDLDLLPPPEAIDRAYWYFLASWQGRNGTAGTERVDYQLAVRWTAGGGSPTVRWRNAVESLPAWHRRLQNVVILCRDAFRFIDRFEDSPKTAIYVDPPYIDSTRSGMNRRSKSGRYLHEFNHERDELFGGDDDHKRLAEILREYKQARIVVSYYDCERARELYDGWTFIDHTRRKHLHASNGKGAAAKTAPEVLIINGLSYGTVVDKGI